MVEVALSRTKFCSSERPLHDPPAQSPPIVEKSSFAQYRRRETIPKAIPKAVLFAPW